MNQLGPQLIEQTREQLIATGLPYIISPRCVDQSGYPYTNKEGECAT